MEIIELFEKCESIKTDLDMHQDALALRTKKLLRNVLKNVFKFEIDVTYIDNLSYEEHVVFYDRGEFKTSFSFLVPVSIEEDEKEILIEVLDYIFSPGKSDVKTKRTYNLGKEGTRRLLELSELTRDAAILLVKLRSQS